MVTLIDWRFVAVTLFGGMVLALICLFDTVPQFRAVRVLGGALLIGASVAYAMFRKTGSPCQYKRAVMAAAVVGIVAAMIYFLTTVAILSFRDSIEVVVSSQSSLLMLRLAGLLTLFSGVGGVIITAILKIRRSRQKLLN